jgi:glycine cleavage system transcriptional repressor
MKRYVVVSAIGKDRPGFVNRITRAIKELDGNIELQRSTRMADEYALIVLFSMEGGPQQVGNAVARLASLRAADMLVNAREALSAPGDWPETASLGELTASGADQPGIIDAVTLVLYQNNINIESMDYDTESAPMTGESLFRMRARIAIPSGTDVAALREKLRQMERQYNFDVILRHPIL